MLKLDFTTAIASLLIIVLFLVFSKWLFYTFFSEGELTGKLKHFQRCPFCTYMFFDYQEKPLCHCPRCKSLLAHDEGEETMRKTNSHSKESGVILLTVIMMTLILSIVVIGLLSTNVGHVKTSQTIIDSIKAQELALGAFYRYHQGRLDNVNAAISEDETLDGKKFTISFPEPPGGPNPNQTNAVKVLISY